MGLRFELGRFVRRIGRGLAEVLRLVGGALLSTIHFREVLLLGGSMLVGVGFAMVWMPAAFIVPGAVLIFVSIVGVS